MCMAINRHTRPTEQFATNFAASTPTKAEQNTTKEREAENFPGRPRAREKSGSGKLPADQQPLPQWSMRATELVDRFRPCQKAVGPTRTRTRPYLHWPRRREDRLQGQYAPRVELRAQCHRRSFLRGQNFWGRKQRARRAILAERLIHVPQRLD